MYLDYSKLWKLLIDKNMTKTELMEETGLSSRIIAKLSKNETVTTETLIKICSCLECDISDIMECKKENNLSLYNYYSKFGKIVDKNENYKTIEFEYKEQKYIVYMIKKPVTKSTIIYCESDGTIYREQLYPFGGTMRPSSVKSSLMKVFSKRDTISIVLFSGKPNFRGLDDGIFISAKNKRKTTQSIYIMTESSFKLFSAEESKKEEL